MEIISHIIVRFIAQYHILHTTMKIKISTLNNFQRSIEILPRKSYFYN